MITPKNPQQARFNWPHTESLLVSVLTASSLPAVNQRPAAFCPRLQQRITLRGVVQLEYGACLIGVKPWAPSPAQHKLGMVIHIKDFLT